MKIRSVDRIIGEFEPIVWPELSLLEEDNIWGMLIYEVFELQHLIKNAFTIPGEKHQRGKIHYGAELWILAKPFVKMKSLFSRLSTFLISFRRSAYFLTSNSYKSQPNSLAISFIMERRSLLVSLLELLIGGKFISYLYLELY